MKTSKLISVPVARVVAALALSACTIVPVSASEWTYKVFDPPAAYQGQFDLRFWFGQGNTSKNLYDTTGSLLVSRLGYNNFAISAGEGVSRFDFNNSWFVKGYAGGGGLWDGNLKDEDFPPAIAPYSATSSSQKFGSLGYGSVDAGLKFVRGPDFHVGLYAGYHFLRETVSAFGCGQIATNPDVCGGGVPDFVKVITQVNNWHSVRLGIDAAFEFNRFKLSTDLAVLPYVYLTGSDAHWLRMTPFVAGAFSSPVPEDGNGWGYQLEGLLSYRVSDALSFGVGGRYWHMETTGNTHFEGRVVGFNALSQPVDWKLDNFGAFVQASVKLGPYPVIGN
jgi:outer membrane protease